MNRWNAFFSEQVSRGENEQRYVAVDLVACPRFGEDRFFKHLAKGVSPLARYMDYYFPFPLPLPSFPAKYAS